MTVPVVPPVVAANTLRFVINAGTKFALGLEVAGASTLAVSASTVILATGIATALVLGALYIRDKQNKI